MKTAFAASLALVLTLACGEADESGPRSSATAKEASVELVDLQQLEAVLASHRGRGLLVNFWAIW